MHAAERSRNIRIKIYSLYLVIRMSVVISWYSFSGKAGEEQFSNGGTQHRACYIISIVAKEIFVELRISVLRESKDRK